MADKFSLKAIISAVDKLSPTLRGIRLNAKITQKSLLDIKGAAGSVLTSMGVTAGAIGVGLWAGVKKIIGVSSEFERFQTILETVEGSAEAARRSMGWVENFAIKTPYELQEVTDSFVKLKAYGIDPVGGALEASGNAAAAMGKPMMQAVEALADAMTGENERLKEFGIRANKAGDNITYSWTENGKTMVAKAKASSKEQIEAVITGIWNRRYGGAMDKLSGTWDGMWSNMLDMATKFIKKIGAGGFFDAVKNQLQGVLATFNQWEKDGTLDRLATEISTNLVGALQDLMQWAKSVDWPAFFRGVRDTTVSIVNLIQALGGLKTIAIALGVFLLAGPVAAIFQIIGAVFALLPAIKALVIGFGALFVANPIILAIVLAVGLLAGAAYLVYKNWGAVKQYFIDLWDGVKTAFNAGLDVIKTVFSYSPLGLIMKSWGPVAKFFGGLWDKVKDIVKASPVQTSGQGPDGAGNGSFSNFAGLNNRTQLNGEMVVKFENSPQGMRVEPGKTNQPGVTLNPDAGYRPFSFGL